MFSGLFLHAMKILSSQLGGFSIKVESFLAVPKFLGIFSRSWLSFTGSEALPWRSAPIVVESATSVNFLVASLLRADLGRLFVSAMRKEEKI